MDQAARTMTAAASMTINFEPLKTPMAADKSVAKAPALVVVDGGLVDNKALTDIFSDATYIGVHVLCRDTVDSKLSVCVAQSSVNVHTRQTITKCIFCLMQTISI